MKKYKEWILRLVPALLVVALTIGMSEMFYRNIIGRTTENCWDELSMVHSDISRQIGSRLNNNMKMLDLASEAIVLNTDLRDEQEVMRYLAGVREATIFDRIDVVFPDGTILVQDGQWRMDDGERSYEELVENGSHLSSRVTDFLTGQQTLHAFCPVYNSNGQAIAILGASVYCSTLADVFKSSYYGDNAQLFLVDMRDGRIVLDRWHETPGSIYDMRVYESPEEYGGDFIDDIMDGRSGTLPYTSELYGETSYTVYAPVEGTHFTLVMVVQEEALFADLNELKKTMTWVGIVEILLLLIVALWIYSVVMRSLKNERRAQKAELALMHQKEKALQSQYAVSDNRREFLEVMAANLPGGYHRCTTDSGFRLTFISNSFTQITGYTMDQVREELDGRYIGIVAPEDREYFLSLAPQLERDGHIHCAYRMRRRDGSIRWVKDSTQYVARDGEQYYQCALADITEQIEEIQRARQAAEASSQAKSTFLFNISHDIRTPMNAIKGFSRIIEENPENPRLVAETIGKINQAGDSLMMLMNDVLDISRIERGKEEVNLQPMDLYEHGKNLYEMFVEDMHAAGIQFLTGGEALDDYVYCDELKLTRIMMNMLSNAKKFTPQGGTVTFGGTRLHRDGRFCTYRFFVRDTGIGMSQEFQKRAFDQFERERTSTESGISGSGLGLAIIKILVELMGGTVEIHSELGKGTEISATLTFQLADRDRVRTPKEENRQLQMTGKRILLVEDNDFNREIARYILEGMQFAVEEAENGAVCIEKLLSVPAEYYDLILMDIQMPVMDGYTATSEIRNMEDRKKAAIPIVAMTANAFEEDKQKCLEVGMNGHLGKPIDMSSLTKVLCELF